MRAYGVDRRDFGCCPGHDKFPNEKYRNGRSRRARTKTNQIAHQRARARVRVEIIRTVKEDA